MRALTMALFLCACAPGLSSEPAPKAHLPVSSAGKPGPVVPLEGAHRAGTPKCWTVRAASDERAWTELASRVASRVESAQSDADPDSALQLLLHRLRRDEPLRVCGEVVEHAAGATPTHRPFRLELSSGNATAHLDALARVGRPPATFEPELPARGIETLVAALLLAVELSESPEVSASGGLSLSKHFAFAWAAREDSYDVCFTSRFATNGLCHEEPRIAGGRAPAILTEWLEELETELRFFYSSPDGTRRAVRLLRPTPEELRLQGSSAIIPPPGRFSSRALTPMLEVDRLPLSLFALEHERTADAAYFHRTPLGAFACRRQLAAWRCTSG